jgi:hypothetical protein
MHKHSSAYAMQVINKCKHVFDKCNISAHMFKQS